MADAKEEARMAVQSLVHERLFPMEVSKRIADSKKDAEEYGVYLLE